MLTLVKVAVHNISAYGHPACILPLKIKISNLYFKKIETDKKSGFWNLSLYFYWSLFHKKLQVNFIYNFVNIVINREKNTCAYSFTPQYSKINSVFVKCQIFWANQIIGFEKFSFFSIKQKFFFFFNTSNMM